MQIDLWATVAKVTAKPPKLDKEGAEVRGPVLQIVLEVEGVEQIGQVARFLGKSAEVTFASNQLHFDDLTKSRETVIAQTR